MSKLHEKMDAYAEALLEEYNEPEGLLKELTAFYLAMLSTYSIAGFDLTCGPSTVKVDGIVQVSDEDLIEVKPNLTVVH